MILLCLQVWKDPHFVLTDWNVVGCKTFAVQIIAVKLPPAGPGLSQTQTTGAGKNTPSG